MVKAKISKKVKKPWGYEELIWQEGDATFKLLHINSGEETSLKYHDKKSEVIIALEDNCVICYAGIRNYIMSLDGYIRNITTPANKGEIHFINAGQVHQFIARGGNTRIAELSYGNDADITRLFDKYEDERK